MSEADDYNHPIFLGRLKRSDQAVWYIAHWLWGQGYHVKINQHREAPTRAEAAKFCDCGDLEVPQKVEVKWLTYAFSGRKDWPHKKIIVCPKWQWDNARPRPLAFFSVSKERNAAAMVEASSRDTWTVEWITDHNLLDAVPEEKYMAPLDQVRWFEITENELVEQEPEPEL